jgi:membrane fusion protein (multidrug efflux system)
MVATPAAMDDELYVAGSVLGNESVDLQPETQGKVIGIYFSEGQAVAKGQLLVKLNDAELLSQLKKAQAQLAIARDKEVRLQKLLEMNGVSREEYESALNLKESLEADIEGIKARLDETEIRAPFAGTVGLRSVSIGSFVAPGTKIAVLEQLDQVKLDLNIPEKYSHLVKQGDLIAFTIEGSATRFTGRVYAIDPRIDPSTRSLKLRAICANPGRELRAGAFARIELALKSKSNALMVPTECIVPDMKGQKIFVVQNGTSQPRPVQTGLRTKDKIEIIQGLNAGDSVITGGLLQIKPGSRVIIMDSK